MSRQVWVLAVTDADGTGIDLFHGEDDANAAYRNAVGSIWKRYWPVEDMPEDPEDALEHLMVNSSNEDEVCLRMLSVAPSKAEVGLAAAARAARAALAEVHRNCGGGADTIAAEPLRLLNAALSGFGE